MSIPQDSVGHASRLMQEGRLPEAREVLRRVLESSPRHAEALHLAGMLEFMSGAPAAALAHLRRCVELAPAAPFAWSNLGVACNATGDFTNALACFQKALELQPGNAVALKNQGIALRHLGRHDEAMASFRRSAQREPNDFELHREVGDLLVDMGRPAEALARYDRALAANPGDAATHHNRGLASWRAGDLERAERDLRRALEIAPDFARAHGSLGVVLLDRGMAADAADSHRRALALLPGNAAFHNNLGIALEALGRREEAVDAYDHALELAPEYVEALENRGAARHALRRHEEALADYERAAARAPGSRHNAGRRLLLKLALCDWNGLQDLVSAIAAGLAAGRPEADPFALCYVDVAPQVRRACAEMHAREVLRVVPPSAWRRPPYSHRRIRVGYFSADMRDHPVGHLLAPLVEGHDRARVEPIGFSFGPDTRDDTRRRLQRAFDRFEDVSGRSTAAIADLARRLELDVAVDLMGYTEGARTAIFAHRVAPVQAQFLGYPGTLGAECIEYLVTDATVVPAEHRPAYSEKVVALPGTCIVADPARPIATATPSRESLGLPHGAVVFCCFCNRAKITPDAFGTWMRILGAVEGSVLWLAHAGEIAARNLRAEAARRGVAPARLAFAPRLPVLAEHFARLRAADLFLDTFHYTGHVTTSDALFAGLPVLTCMGGAFPSRVSASLVRAAGLPELVVATPAEYEARAIGLARDPAALAALRDRLERNRAASGLFDPPALAHRLEDAYARMLERFRAGLPPDHIDP